jgi:hypothetical protein
VGLDAGESPGRNERRWLVVGVLDCRKSFFHKGSDWSMIGKRLIERLMRLFFRLINFKKILDRTGDCSS